MRRFIQASFVCSVLAGSAFIAIAQTQPRQIAMQNSAAAIDYPMFLKLSAEAHVYRKDRLVSKSTFLEMASRPNTLILDTRSKEAYDQGHIEGAVHLNFSDFTEGKLAKVIGDKDRQILIYCNNNFAENETPFLRKKVELALNIPTFINLYGYGYKNIFELEDSVSMTDPDMKIVSSPQ